MKKILIISDNLFICKEFEKIIKSIKLPNLKWDFSISPFSDLQSFSDSLENDISVKDLKDMGHINAICENYDMVFSVHCKQLFPDKLVSSVKCINIHPGYNPINRGWYPQVFAIINECPVGATIHEIDNQLDHGLIIDREFVKKEMWDTSLTLYNKIVELEISLIKKNIVNILNNSYESIKPETEGFLYLKKDFKDLCEIQLEKYQTVSETINLLRALSHGDYKNAYFIDPQSGVKVFISIDLSVEKNHN